MQIVNGYQCRNCTDVSLAKKNIDPAHPKDGPADAARAKQARHREIAVEFGGVLSRLHASNGVSGDPQTKPAQVPRPGALFSIVA